MLPARRPAVPPPTARCHARTPAPPEPGTGMSMPAPASRLVCAQGPSTSSCVAQQGGRRRRGRVSVSADYSGHQSTWRRRRIAAAAVRRSFERRSAACGRGRPWHAGRQCRSARAELPWCPRRAAQSWGWACQRGRPSLQGGGCGQGGAVDGWVGGRVHAGDAALPKPAACWAWTIWQPEQTGLHGFATRSGPRSRARVTLNPGVASRGPNPQQGAHPAL